MHCSLTFEVMTPVGGDETPLTQVCVPVKFSVEHIYLVSPTHHDKSVHCNKRHEAQGVLQPQSHYMLINQGKQSKSFYHTVQDAVGIAQHPSFSPQDLGMKGVLVGQPSKTMSESQLWPHLQLEPRPKPLIRT